MSRLDRKSWPPSGPFIYGPEKVLIAAAFTDGHGPSRPTYDKMDCIPFSKVVCEILAEDPIAISSEWPEQKGKPVRAQRPKRRPKREKLRAPRPKDDSWDYARKAMEAQAIRDEQRILEAQAIHDRYLRTWKQTCLRHGGIQKTVSIIMETADDRPPTWFLCGRYLIQSLRYDPQTCSVTDIEAALITGHPVWCTAQGLAQELVETTDQRAVLKKHGAILDCTFCLSVANEKALANSNDHAAG
jgi:hypothetical protein